MAAEARANLGLAFRIEVDGGITTVTGPQAKAAGADTLVVGTAAFNAPDMAVVIKTLRER